MLDPPPSREQREEVADHGSPSTFAEDSILSLEGPYTAYDKLKSELIKRTALISGGERKPSQFFRGMHQLLGALPSADAIDLTSLADKVATPSIASSRTRSLKEVYRPSRRHKPSPVPFDILPAKFVNYLKYSYQVSLMLFLTINLLLSRHRPQIRSATPFSPLATYHSPIHVSVNSSAP